MEAEVVGINRVDFRGRDGLVKQTRFALVIDTGDISEGKDVDNLSWNEVEEGPPPAFKVGQKVKIRYGKKGKISFEKLPTTATTA
jgi:hypothetical protein